MACDVTELHRRRSARAMRRVKAFGRIDILVNNAGIAGPNVADLGVSVGGLVRGDARQPRRRLPIAAAPWCRS